MDSGNTQRNISTSQKQVSDLRVIELFIVLFIIWVLIDLWVIFFRNLAVRTLGLNEKNTVHSFAFALAVTIILLGFIILAGDSFQETLVNIGAVPDEFNPAGIIGGEGTDVDVDGNQVDQVNPEQINQANQVIQATQRNKQVERGEIVHLNTATLDDLRKNNAVSPTEEILSFVKGEDIWNNLSSPEFMIKDSKKRRKKRHKIN